MERLGKLVRRLKEAIETKDVAEVGSVDEVELEWDEGEKVIIGHAMITVTVGPIEDLRGNVDWPDVEGKAKGILRSLELQIIPLLQDTESKTLDLPGRGEYDPDWEEHGEIEWSRQKMFRLTRDESVETEIEVRYRDEP